MKKFFIFILLLHIVAAGAFVAYADDKLDTITVTVSGMNDDLYYLDILVKEELISDTSEFDKSNYDQQLIDNLFKHSRFGWMPATVCGTKININGSITPKASDDGDVFVFSAKELPDTVRIIVTSQNGDTKTSDVVRIKGTDVKISFDYVTSSVSVDTGSSKLYVLIALMFVLASVITFCIFSIQRVSPKNNFKLITAINLIWTLFYVTIIHMFGIDTLDLHAILIHLLCGITMIVSAVVAFSFLAVGRSPKKLVFASSYAFIASFVGCFALMVLFGF